MLQVRAKRVCLCPPLAIIHPVTLAQAGMRQLSAFFWVCLALTTVMADEEPAKEQTVLQRLFDAQRAVTTRSGKFTQLTVRADDPTEVLTEYQGHFDFQAPDKYNLVYTKPGDDESRLRKCSDGKKRWTIDVFMAGERPDVSVKPVAAVGGQGAGEDNGLEGSITELLCGGREAVLRDFTIEATATDSGFSLVLTPKPGPIADHLVKAEAELDALGHVQVLRFFDRQGNRITITVKEAVYNQPIPPETFTYSAP